MTRRLFLWMPLLLVVLTVICWSAVSFAEPADQGEEGGQGEAAEAGVYVGEMPDNDKLKVLAEHRVIARFTGVNYRECIGKTMLCPDRCGSSGEYGMFTVLDYLVYNKPGQFGDAKQKTYMIQISDFNRKPIDDPKLVGCVKQLEAGDLVILEWKHLYGEVSPKTSSPVRPLLLMQPIDEAQAQALREARDKAADEAEDDVEGEQWEKVPASP